MIIVTGASGQLGSQTVRQLLARLPAGQIGVSVRDPAKVPELTQRGVRVRRGDFAEPDTLDAAFEGATQVLVVSVDVLGEAGIAANRTAIDAAYRAGAQRVFYTSHQAAGPDSAFPPARDHAAVEAYLRELGRPYTSLRNGFYASSLLYRTAGAVESGELAAPADGPVSWTTIADLAEGAAVLLADAERSAGGTSDADRPDANRPDTARPDTARPDTARPDTARPDTARPDTAPFDGPTPPLTAAAALDLAGVAAILAQRSGRPVRRVVIDDEDWVARTVAQGAPEAMARLFLGTFEASRNGEFDVVDPTLSALIGHEPKPVRDVLTPADR